MTQNYYNNIDKEFDIREELKMQQLREGWTFKGERRKYAKPTLQRRGDMNDFTYRQWDEYANQHN